jgi:hypothetical protein
MSERVIPLGGMVLCDIDSTDLTTDPRSGGYLFGSYGVGPCCAERYMKTIEKYNEQWNIKAYCPKGMSFADWCRKMRAESPLGDNIKVHGDDALADELEERFNSPEIEGISLCKSCYCMTKTIHGKCGKCGEEK